jgi:DNA-binding HxlR family transcriptional regulator
MPNRKPPELELAAYRGAVTGLLLGLQREARNRLSHAAPKLVADPETVLVAAAVLNGHAEQRPMNVTAIERNTSVDRRTVSRRLKELQRHGIIVKHGGYYYWRDVHVPRPVQSALRRVLLKAYSLLRPFICEPADGDDQRHRCQLEKNQSRIALCMRQKIARCSK